MNDKKPLVAHSDYGKDEDNTQALIKKHEAVELDIEGYNTKVQELSGESQRLIDRGHFDSDTITERQVSVTMYASPRSVAHTSVWQCSHRYISFNM